MISSDGGDAKRQRTEERKGVAPPPLARQEDRRERRRKWKNLINEIIPQSTSIRLHSGRGSAHKEAARSVYLVHRKDHTVEENLSLCLSSYYQGQSWAKPLLCLQKVDHISHSFSDLNPTSNKLYIDCRPLQSGLCKATRFALRRSPGPQMFAIPLYSFPLLWCALVIYSTHAEWQPASRSKTLAPMWVMWICVHADVVISVTSFCLLLGHDSHFTLLKSHKECLILCISGWNGIFAMGQRVYILGFGAICCFSKWKWFDPNCTAPRLYY